MKNFRLSFGGGWEATGAGLLLALLAGCVTLGVGILPFVLPEAEFLISGLHVGMMIGIPVAAGVLIFLVGALILRVLGIPIAKQKAPDESPQSRDEEKSGMGKLPRFPGS